MTTTTATPITSLAKARAFGRAAAMEAEIGTEGLVLTAAVREAARKAGTSAASAEVAAVRAEAAADEAFFTIRTRQASAHKARAWCPSGGCPFCGV